MARIFDFIANSGDGVFAVDRRQSIVLWNDRATEILGFSAAETVGKKCCEVVCGRDAQGCVVCRRGCDAFASARRLRPAQAWDMAVRTKSGDEVWLNLSTVVVPSRRKDLAVLVHLFRDVTREHELLRVAQDFAAMVSGAAPERPARRPWDAQPPQAPAGLTLREREVLTFLASGTSTDAIAREMRITPRTVRNHVNNILGKLKAHSRLEAVTFSIRNGLV